MSSGKRVFIIGPGFIGWNVLDLLVSEGYSVTGFVRRQQHAEQIKASGATAVVLGDLNDKDVITEQVTQHDIVLHTATADHLPSVEAVLQGIKQRAESGQSTTFIHTSGTAILDDGAAGSKKSDKIYHDNVRSEIDSVPDNAPHRPIDLAIKKAHEELGAKAKIAIVIPPLIHGFNPKHNRLTIQIPALTRFAIKHGYSVHVGQGASVESSIHVYDLARAYVVLFHHMESSAPEKLLDNPYYFCESTGENEPSWREVAALIGEQLHLAGVIQDPDPRELDPGLYGEIFGPRTPVSIGLNSRSRAVRLRELGWQPREKDWKRSYVEGELPAILKEGRGSSIREKE